MTVSAFGLDVLSRVRGRTWHWRHGMEQTAQAKPTRVADDLLEWGAPREGVYEILLKRGVFKSLAGMRDLFKVSDRLKGKVRDANKEIYNLRQLAKYHRAEATKERLSALVSRVEWEADVKERGSHWNRFHQTVARRHYMRGYLKGLEEARAEVRAITHSPRWRAPDNDSQASKWLDSLEAA
jgi:hypothetical protein